MFLISISILTFLVSCNQQEHINISDIFSENFDFNQSKSNTENYDLTTYTFVSRTAFIAGDGVEEKEKFMVIDYNYNSYTQAKFFLEQNYSNKEYPFILIRGSRVIALKDINGMSNHFNSAIGAMLKEYLDDQYKSSMDFKDVVIELERRIF